MANNLFGDFTNLYSLSKTLRFELKPVGKTLENMRKHLRYDESLQTFLADQEIEDAYQKLKPVFDHLHEKFIGESLESEAAQKITFDDYLELYRNRKNVQERDIENEEKKLRSQFAAAYETTADLWKKRTGNNAKEKPILGEKSFKILTERGILEFIRKNIDTFAPIQPVQAIEKALTSFEGFFTYFGGFNQNRENYYETGKEASTAVATRIVHENLPKFCDNMLFFENRSKEYTQAHDELRALGRSLVTKEGKSLFPIMDNLFRIEYFNTCLSQAGIEHYNDQIGNANFLINLYNQAKSHEAGFKRLSLFKTLYKQIGCGKRGILFFSLTHETSEEAEKARQENKEAFSVQELLLLAQKAGEMYFQGKSNDGLINTIPELLDYLRTRENYLGIYWSKAAINTISNKCFASWHELKDVLKKEKVFLKSESDSGEDVKIPDAVELEGFFRVLDQTLEWRTIFFRKSILEDEKKLEVITQSPSVSQALLQLLFSEIQEHSELFLQELGELMHLEKYKEHKEKVKSCFDHALAVTQMLKYFLVKENKVKGTPIDATLLQALDAILHGKIELDGKIEEIDWFKWYDALRNYLTRKPQDTAKENKLKLNFENSTLAGGWDVNKEPDNYCVLLESPERKQFLAIIAKETKQKGYNKIFEKQTENLLYQANQQLTWKKMEYKLLPGPNKMLPKCLLPKSDRSKYGATQEVLDVYDRGSFKKTESNFSISDLHILINFYKSALKRYEDWTCFDFSFKPTQDYTDIGQFYAEVEKQGYKLDFVDINYTRLEQWTNEGKIYLFEVRNQDSNAGKKEGHRENLHTIYWKALFENVDNRPKLNGEAELFYRKAVPVEKMEKVMDKQGRERIKNYRFSQEKFVFHVPITLNFCLKNEKVNDLVNGSFSKQPEIYFLGLDRGEKHLAYYCLSDRNGKIVTQDTLNLPFTDKDEKPRSIKTRKRFLDANGIEHEVEVECKDYNELLEARAGDRNYARKNWQTIGTIKELKAGYISQVVRTIAGLATDEARPTFIVLEDLNTGFKRGRQKIEKSVYQKFELALAKKLNFLVDKNVKNGETGSVTKALQLTPPVNNYGDIENRKQVGIMLYTRANYTSQTDPVTGWRKTIYLKTGSEESIKKQIIDSFSDITFDGKDYVFSYATYLDKEQTQLLKKWELFSGKDGSGLHRFRGERGKDKNEWHIKRHDIVDMLDGLFTKFDKSRSLLAQIVDEGMGLEKINNHTPWESLRFAIDLIQQIRNTGLNERDGDFLLSPIRDANGNHFDSRVFWDRERSGEKAAWPSSGDANGAFNIARKGIIMQEHIRRGYRLFISDTEWDAWLAGREMWEEWVGRNKEILKRKENRISFIEEFR